MSMISVGGHDRAFNPAAQPPLPLQPGPWASGAPRVRRDASTANNQIPQRFLSEENATQGDANLQERLMRGLLKSITSVPVIPRNASIAPFISVYTQALSEQPLQDWLRAKGLKLATVRVFNDHVTGVVTQDGKDTLARFTTSDGSGWGAVSAHVSAAQQALSPSNFGLGVTEYPVPRHAILDFYGVQPPRNEQSASALGQQLKRDGWPPILPAQRVRWREQYTQLTQARGDATERTRLLNHLRRELKHKAVDDDLNLDQQPFTAEPGSSLARRSKAPRNAFVELLASQSFKAFLAKNNLVAHDDQFRISQGDLQLRTVEGGWVSLQATLDAELSEHSQPHGDTLRDGLRQLVVQSRKTGNALYSTDTYDVCQALDFFCLGAPKTHAQVEVAMAWLDTRLAPAPLAAGFAQLTPYTWAPGALSIADCGVLKHLAAGTGGLLDSFLARPDPWHSLPDADHRLAAFFDSPAAVAKAQAMAKGLQLYAVAGGQPLSKAIRHQLLATALKLEAGGDVPGRPGFVAGYEVYSPNKLGRSQKALRSDIEQHLQGKGASAHSAPLLAHMFLAQTAPELLVKADSAAPGAALFKQSSDDITLGSTAWLGLRLGCALADTLAGPGASRLMSRTQLLALTQLQAQVPEQETLIKSLAARPLLEWAVMAGVFPKPSDGRYSPENYQQASAAFTAQQALTDAAFSTLTSEPPTQTSVLIGQLTRLFPELTEQEIRDFKLKRVYHTMQGSRPPVLLTEVLLAGQAKLGLLAQLTNWMTENSTGKVQYELPPGTISQATFDERIKQLPLIAPLVAPAIDRYVADTRSAQASALKLMIAQLPLAERKALEVGQIEFFSLRKATAETLKEDSGDESKVAQSKGIQGTLIRYETGIVTPRFGYYEVFPGSMRMIKRDDLPYSLSLGGEIKREQRPFGPFAYTREDVRREKTEAFDFQAYSSGTEPRAGVQSPVIIEKAASDLAATLQKTGGNHTGVPVPNSFASDKTARIVEGILGNSFDERRDALTAYANQPTNLQRQREFPFGADDVFSSENLRMVLGLLPFVGAVADIAEGNVAQGLKGLLIDFASFAATGGVGGARSFFKGLKVVLPFNGRAFTMQGLKGAAPFFRSLFNPLDGTVGLLKSGQKAPGLLKSFLKGELRLLDTGIYLPATAFERCRWGAGVYGSVAGGQPAGAQQGTCDGQELYAVQKNNHWYGVNPCTFETGGAPLQGFVPQAVMSQAAS